MKTIYTHLCTVAVLAVLLLWTSIEVLILRRHSTGEIDGED